MALLTLDCEVQMYEKRLELEIQRKVAESVVAAEISDHLNAFSNISWRGTKINFYLSVFSLFYPCPSNLSPSLLQPENYSSPHSASVLIFLCALLREQ